MPSASRHLLIGTNHPFNQFLDQELHDRYGADTVQTVSDTNLAAETIPHYNPTDVYLLTCPLAPAGPEVPLIRWHRYTRELVTVLDLATTHRFRVFYPSAIHVFGHTAPYERCPNDALQDATSFFGLSKRSGERWCEQYYHDYDVDVRSLRFPVLIHRREDHPYTPPSAFFPAATTDQPRPILPLEEAVRATIELMAAPTAAIRQRRSYNLGGISVPVGELLRELAHHNPTRVFDAWNIPEQPGPASMDDTAARTDWGWRPRYDLLGLVRNLLQAPSDRQ